MNVIITGACGYIGKSFIDRYNEVYNLIPISLRKTPIDQIIFSDVDAIIHLSAIVHQPDSSEESYFRVNAEQTVQLARTAKSNNIKHFVFLSSVAVYGSHGSISAIEVLNEHSPCTPNDPYGKSKLQAEEALRKMEDDSFRVTIIRSPVVYGKNAPGNMEKLRLLTLKSPILPFKNNRSTRSVVSINNLTSFIAQVLETRTTGVLIPQDREPVTVGYIVEIFCRSLSKKPLLFCTPTPLLSLPFIQNLRIVKSLFGSLIFDSTETNSRLGFTPPYQTEEELIRMSDD